MRSFVATGFVSVALFSAASPAFADTHQVLSALEGGNSSFSQVNNTDGVGQKYWTARSEYFEISKGVAATAGEAPHKVLISGWHPVAGFEAEIAEEAANRAAHSGH